MHEIEHVLYVSVARGMKLNLSSLCTTDTIQPLIQLLRQDINASNAVSAN